MQEAYAGFVPGQIIVVYEAILLQSTGGSHVCGVCETLAR